MSNSNHPYYCKCNKCSTEVDSHGESFRTTDSDSNDINKSYDEFGEQLPNSKKLILAEDETQYSTETDSHGETYRVLKDDLPAVTNNNNKKYKRWWEE